MEDLSDFENIVHFYRPNKPRHSNGRWLEVTEFSTRGGRNLSSAKAEGDDDDETTRSFLLRLQRNIDCVEQPHSSLRRVRTAADAHE